MKTASTRMIIGLTVLLLLSPGAWGFPDPDLHVTIRFDRIDGLTSGDRVLFEENHIGNVESVTYEKEGRYTVEISIQSNFINAATTLSEFYVVNDPQAQKKRAIQMVQVQPGGSVLKQGAVVEGSNSRSLLLKRLSRDIDQGLNELRGELKDLQKDMENIPHTDEYRELKRELSETAKQLERAVRESKEKMRKELLPLLIRKLEELKERLKEQGKEKSEPISPETV
ncbi:MAG: MlaD family protein [Deltaproteobacteria bacterium]|nr:MlaD family protein [Deltaproteobacteria bacterium]